MRPRKPWYRASKNAWYVNIDGKQHLLAKGRYAKAEAEAVFYRLMASEGRIPSSENRLNVASLCDLFLDFSEKHNKPETYAWHKTYLTSFCRKYARFACGDIKPYHLTRWLDANPGWVGARRSAQVIVKRAFSWGKAEGLISEHPLQHVKNPAINKRERVLTEAERQQILDATRDRAFKMFLKALFGTGCRPSEVATVTAADVNLELGIWLFKQHKTAKKTGKPRIVYLSPEMLEMTRSQMALYSTGPLFRNRKHKPFTRNAWRCRFRTLRKNFPNLKDVVAYSARHTYATDALIKGVGVAQVATLLGHSNTNMVVSTYSHIAANITHMREAAAKATG